MFRKNILSLQRISKCKDTNFIFINQIKITQNEKKFYF